MQSGKHSTRDRRYLRSFISITAVLLGLAFSSAGGAQQQASDGASAGGTAAPAPSTQGQKQDQSQNQNKEQNQSGKDAKKDPSKISSTPVPQTSSPGAPYDPGTVIQVHTRLVTLDIVATDAKGHAITDLQLKDFAVLEDGKPQQVRVFTFQHPVAPNPKVQLPTLPANVFTNIPRFHQSSAMNVILFDVMNTPITDQAYARGKVLHYLENMPANEPTAIYILGSKLKLVHDFTTDSPTLREAVQKTNIQSSLLLDSETDENPLPNAPNIPGAADAQIHLEQLRRTMRIDITLQALQTIAHALAGYEGRKNLIWISAAFPLTVDPNFTLDPATSADFDLMENHAGKVAKTAQVVTDSQVSIYPVDPRGLVGYSTFSAANGRAMSGPQLSNALLAESRRLTATHDTMNVLAENTGGKAFYNRNDIDKEIYDSVTDGSTYYMVGYYPENKKWDGKFRKVQVKVERPGVKLRYKLGYFASDPDPFLAKPSPKQRDRDLGEALSLDRPNSTSLFFAAGIIPPSEQTQNHVLINYAIAPHALMVNRGNDGLEHAEVECLAQAYNEKGKPVGTANVSTEQASMKPDTYQRVLQTGFPCRNQMDLPQGSYRLRLVVRDARTGMIGTSDAAVTVPALAALKPKDAKDEKKAQ